MSQTEKPTRTPRDMALSLIVLMIPVLLIVGAYRFLQKGDQPVVVDPTEDIASAQRDGLTHLPPAAAPDGWLIITSQYRDRVLRIGYLDPDRHGVQLTMSKSDAITAEKAEPGETRLIGHADGVTVVLRGRGADLQPLAALLTVPVSASSSSQ